MGESARTIKAIEMDTGSVSYNQIEMNNDSKSFILIYIHQNHMI